MREDGDPIPNEFQEVYELIFTLGIHALLNHYNGILTRAALSKITGINEKQLGHYIQGIRTPRPIQREKIIKGIHQLGQELIKIN